MAHTPASNHLNYTKDDDEIDLDENDDDMEGGNGDATTGVIPAVNSTNDSTSIDNDTIVPLEQQDVSEREPEVDAQPISKADAMKWRMRQLKQKMNQARQLNQQAVREEVEASLMMGNGSRTGQKSKKNKASSAIGSNQNSYAVRLAQEHAEIDPKFLLQPAYENLSKQQKKQEKDELNQYAINDYHNPEGQYRNYQRNVNSLPNHTNSVDMEPSNGTAIHNPSDLLTTSTDELKKQRDGAHRISQELQRRYEKRQTKERKRKQQEIRQELNNTTSTTAGASGINLRNQKFNQKIARTYDATTSEIRHNLERGTAL